MRKSKIIKRLKKENEHDVEFIYNFDKLKEKLSFTSSTKKSYQSILYYKYATLALSFIVLILTSLLINNYTKHNISIDSSATIETELDEVYNHFTNLNATYLKFPIKTFIINEEIVQLFIGVLDNNEVVLIYTSTKENQNKIEIYPTNTESIDIPEDVTPQVEKFYTPIITTTSDYYLVVFEGKDSQYLNNYTSSINIKEYIEFLKD